jgi:hypothetical protein
VAAVVVRTSRRTQLPQMSTVTKRIWDCKSELEFRSVVPEPIKKKAARKEAATEIESTER